MTYNLNDSQAQMRREDLTPDDLLEASGMVSFRLAWDWQLETPEEPGLLSARFYGDRQEAHKAAATFAELMGTEVSIRRI